MLMDTTVGEFDMMAPYDALRPENTIAADYMTEDFDTILMIDKDFGDDDLDGFFSVTDFKTVTFSEDTKVHDGLSDRGRAMMSLVRSVPQVEHWSHTLVRTILIQHTSNQKLIGQVTHDVLELYIRMCISNQHHVRVHIRGGRNCDQRVPVTLAWKGGLERLLSVLNSMDTLVPPSTL